MLDMSKLHKPQVSNFYFLLFYVYRNTDGRFFSIFLFKDRHEPNSNGEVNFLYVLRTLENAGYKDWIGCEYKPKTESADGLNWISEFGYKL